MLFIYMYTHTGMYMYIYWRTHVQSTFETFALVRICIYLYINN